MRNKLLTGLVIALLVANIVTIIMFWMGMKKDHPRPGTQAKEYIIKELSFNDTQQKQYKEMVDEHRKQSRAITDQIKACKDSFFSLLGNENINESQKNELSARSAFLNQQLELITFEHFKKVRAICNPAQQQQFDKIIKDVLKMMGGPGGPPGGRRPEGPPPGEGGPPPPGN